MLDCKLPYYFTCKHSFVDYINFLISGLLTSTTWPSKFSEFKDIFFTISRTFDNLNITSKNGKNKNQIARTEVKLLIVMMTNNKTIKKRYISSVIKPWNYCHSKDFSFLFYFVYIIFHVIQYLIIIIIIYHHYIHECIWMNDDDVLCTLKYVHM
jgi:hypothetical protein